MRLAALFDVALLIGSGDTKICELRHKTPVTAQDTVTALAAGLIARVRRSIPETGLVERPHLVHPSS